MLVGRARSSIRFARMGSASRSPVDWRSTRSFIHSGTRPGVVRSATSTWWSRTLRPFPGRSRRRFFSTMFMPAPRRGERCCSWSIASTLYALIFSSSLARRCRVLVLRITSTVSGSSHLKISLRERPHWCAAGCDEDGASIQNTSGRSQRFADWVGPSTLPQRGKTIARA